MPSFMTPGVYIDENLSFLPAVAQVETAVPVFIGYTEKALMDPNAVADEPVLLSTLAEFERIFGGAPSLKFGIVETQNAQLADFSNLHGHYRCVAPAAYFRLYRSLQLYFYNGGGACYIISLGNYADNVIEKKAMEKALTSLTGFREPTLLVNPDAVSLSSQDCYSIQQSMLVHCAKHTRNRVAILDIYEGFRAIGDSVTPFRNHVENAGVGEFGAAYYPWVNTALVDEADLDYRVFDNDARAVLQKAITRELGKTSPHTKAIISAITAGTSVTKRMRRLRTRYPYSHPGNVDKILRSLSATYRSAMHGAAKKLSLMPPSAAIAGVYVRVDTQRGVWKAPANIRLRNVVSPAVAISGHQQQLLTSDPEGKSVNAIRHFTGKGSMVWGARTLDGNDPQWKYISVRRTCIMLEQQIDNALNAAVFEPNDQPLWSALKQLISNALLALWRQGGLAGEKPEHGFVVRCGLGETMTQADIAAGKLKVSLGIAMVRPAEFIILPFERNMQVR